MKEEVEQLLLSKGARGGAPRAGSRIAPLKSVPVSGTPTRGTGPATRRLGAASKTPVPTQSPHQRVKDLPSQTQAIPSAGSKKARSTTPADLNDQSGGMSTNAGPATVPVVCLATSLATVTILPSLGAL